MRAVIRAYAVRGGAVRGKHIDDIFARHDLPVVDADHRRVLAVLRFLGAFRACEII
ncbi:hypothetical protein ACFXB3_00490 [Streptomyces sp. NPDC059447]|uniref:hypothetical protein n=1 Tax=Streptomyces sp. NPDC059447 TaxID=3346834 RepID=UPI0036A19A8C